MESEFTGKRQLALFKVLLALSLTSPFLVLFAHQMPITRASTDTVVEVEPQINSAGISQNFTINVTVANIQNLYGFDLLLSWNSTVLEVARIDVRLGLSDGALYNTVFQVENSTQIDTSTQEGNYSLVAASETPAPSFNGTGNLVRITFDVKTAGASNLTLAASLADRPPPDGPPSQPIDHQTIDGIFSSTIPEISNPTVLLIPMAFAVCAVVFIGVQKRNRCKRQTAIQQSRTIFISSRKSY